MLNKFKKIETKKILVIFLIFYFIVFSSAVVLKHISMQTALFDFGLEAQVIRKTSELKLFKSGVEVPNYLGDHFSPLPIVLSTLVYKILPSDFTILLIQPLLIVIGLWYFYKLCINFKLKPHIALLFTILMGFVPGIQSAVLFDYHPIIYAFPILLAAIYYDKKGKLLLSIGLFFLACLVKEDVGIFVAGYGILQILERRKIGLLLTLLGIGITYLSMFYLIPTIRGEMSDSLSRYSEFGTNGVEIVKNILFKPIDTIKYLATLHNLKYILILFVPFLFIPLIKIKELLVLFIPLFALNVFSNFINQTDGERHYDLVISIALGYMLILGWIKLQNIKVFKESFKKVVLTIFVIILLLLPFYNLLIDISKVNIEKFNDYLELKSITKNIDKNTTIGTTNLAGGQLSSFNNLYIVYPEWVNNKGKRFDYLLFYLQEFEGNDFGKTMLMFPNYKSVYSSSKFLLLKN